MTNRKLTIDQVLGRIDLSLHNALVAFPRDDPKPYARIAAEAADHFTLIQQLATVGGSADTDRCDDCQRETVASLLVTLPDDLAEPATADEPGIAKVCPACAHGYVMNPCEGCGRWFKADDMTLTGDDVYLCPACAGDGE